MTQHVKTAYRRHRRGTWGAALAIVSVAALVVAVLPAGAGTGGTASGSGIEPNLVDLGGQPNDCTAVGSAGTEVRVPNPTNNLVVDTLSGKLKLRIYSSGGVQYLDFAPTTGGTGYYVVNDVIVKGGQKSIHYDYDAVTGATTSDTLLHAPPKGGGYFTISHVSFCVSNAASLVTELACGEGATDTAGRYSVELGSATDGNCTKAGDNPYIFESYVRPDGSVYYRFVPYLPPASSSGKILLVEHLTGTHTQSPTDTTPQVNLFYDDFVGAGVRQMPYCTFDPRTSDPDGTTLAPRDTETYPTIEDYAAAVLPTGHTSCLLQSAHVVDDSSSDGAIVTFDFWVFSSVDGSRTVI